MIEAIRQDVIQSLEEGCHGVLTLRQRWGQVGPYLFTQPQEVSDLVIEPRYPLADLICALQAKYPEKKWGAVVRGCDERALRKLEERGLFRKEGFLLIGVACTQEQAQACNCEKPIYTTFQCTGCWKCLEKCEKKAIERINVCPILRPNEFDLGLSKRKAIYIPFPQAIPHVNTRDAAHCLKLTGHLECQGCQNVCEAKAIEHEMADQMVDVEVGAILVATGCDLYDPSPLGEYGYGKVPNVITAMEYERLTSASGPTRGELERRSDGRIPSTVAFIQCVGSRDFKNNPFCSSVCCMYATKEAILANEHHPETKSYIFYIDLRAVGKRFQEYVSRAQQEYNATYIRARPGKIEANPQTDNPLIWYEDTTSGETKSLEVELVVLCQALVPSLGIREVASKLGIGLDEHGFVKLPDGLSHPVDTETPGIFACGYAHSPRDIPDSVVQASAAAARVAEALGAGD